MFKKLFTKSNLFYALSVLAGNVLYAVTIKLFLLPVDLVSGGATGIAIIINIFTGFPVSRVLLVLNVFFLLLSFLLLGKRSTYGSIASTFISPIVLEFLDLLLGDIVLTTDLFLCSFFSGLGIGISLGIVFRAGATTGGLDIVPLALHKYFHIPAGVAMYACDFIVILSQAFMRDLSQTLYGIIVMIVYTIVMDQVIMVGSTRVEMKIVSHKTKEIRDAILEELERGVTMLHGETGYLRQQTDVLFTIISRKQIAQAQKIIRRIDPTSFLIISSVKEVHGNGFTETREDPEKPVLDEQEQHEV